MKKTTKNLTLLLALAGAIALLTACGTPTVKETSLIDYQFQATNPLTQEVLLTGENLQVQIASGNSQLFELLKGAKEAEVRTAELQDPFAQHDPLLREKIPTFVLEQLGIELGEVGNQIQIGDQTFVFAGTGSENEVELATLDKNPLTTAIPLEWQFTITKIH